MRPLISISLINESAYCCVFRSSKAFENLHMDCPVMAFNFIIAHQILLGSIMRSSPIQGCCLTGARSPGAPWLRAWATKVLYKEPERAPNFITKAIDPNFLVNYIPVAGHNTVKVLMYLASVSTRETCKNSQTIST